MTASGKILQVKAPVQEEGTRIGFSNGYTIAEMAAGGTMKLGGKTISQSSPTALDPTLQQ